MSRDSEVLLVYSVPLLYGSALPTAESVSHFKTLVPDLINKILSFLPLHERLSTAIAWQHFDLSSFCDFPEVMNVNSSWLQIPSKTALGRLMNRFFVVSIIPNFFRGEAAALPALDRPTDNAFPVFINDGEFRKKLFEQFAKRKMLSHDSKIILNKKLLTQILVSVAFLLSTGLLLKFFPTKMTQSEEMLFEGSQKGGSGKGSFDIFYSSTFSCENLHSSDAANLFWFAVWPVLEPLFIGERDYVDALFFILFSQFHKICTGLERNTLSCNNTRWPIYSNTSTHGGKYYSNYFANANIDFACYDNLQFRANIAIMLTIPAMVAAVLLVAIKLLSVTECFNTDWTLWGQRKNQYVSTSVSPTDAEREEAKLAYLLDRFAKGQERYAQNRH